MNSSLFTKTLRYNMDAHRANPANLFAGAVGMIINNSIFLVGMWGMLFAGKPENAPLLPYYIALNAVVMFAWGNINFFLGGLKSLGLMITEGTLEPMLATPRNPVFLAGISHSHPVALGDLVMGVTGIIALAVKYDVMMAIRALIAGTISAVGFAALFIFAGSISFFVTRGNHVGQLLIEITTSLSAYPAGKMFSGVGRIFLLLTPAAATAVLPLDAFENLTAFTFLFALFSALLFFGIALGLFRIGLKRYHSVSLLGTRS